MKIGIKTGVLSVLPMSLLWGSAYGAENFIDISGYARESISINLNTPQIADAEALLFNTLDQVTGVAAGTPGWTPRPVIEDQDFKYEPSMIRTTLQLEVEGSLWDVGFNIVGAVDREISTNFLDALGDASYGNDEFVDKFYNTEKINEFYLTKTIGDTTIRAGKQILSWGEADFVRGIDIINGIDRSKRGGFTPELEDLKKGLIMLNVVQAFDDWDATLQVIYRPGWDDDEDLGDTVDLKGGRWTSQPFVGYSFFQTAMNSRVIAQGLGLPQKFVTVPYYDLDAMFQTGADVLPNLYKLSSGLNFRKDGNYDDETWAVRWEQMLGNSVNYAVSWAQTFASLPLVNPNLSNWSACAGTGTFGCPANAADYPAPASYGNPAANATEIGEFFQPKVEVFGFAANAYSDALDLVWNIELAYTPDNPYQVGGKNSQIDLGLGALGVGPIYMNGSVFTGYGGIKEKDTLMSIFRIDKTVDLTNVLYTARPSFLSLQLIDTWIMDYDRMDDIIVAPGYGNPKREHSLMASFVLAMNYKSDEINPTIAMLYDITYGGAVFIPSVDLLFGDHWRVKFEVDYFFGGHEKSLDSAPDDYTSQLSGLANSSQFLTRITYQF